MSFAALHPLSLVIGAGISALVVGLVLELRALTRIRAAKKRSLNAARSTLRGHAVEQLAPLLPDFEYAMKDARFLGAPVDYVIFDGMSDDDDELDVIFVEVKSGRARLSARERKIRDAVNEGRVRFEVLRVK